MSQKYMNDTNSAKIGEALHNVLADTFVLYFKTHSFHWNVTGPAFKALHDLFEEQYTELWNVTDEIAERMRAIDYYAPVSIQDTMKQASLSEVGQLPDSSAMVKMLASDNRAIVTTLYNALEVAQEAGDEATTDLLIGRIATHEKTAWMLESMAKG